jgi:hypothetical protein
MKPPRTKNSFYAVFKDVEPPKDYSEENRQMWLKKYFLKPVVDTAINAVKAIGKRTKDDLIEVRDEFVDNVEQSGEKLRDDVLGVLVPSNITARAVQALSNTQVDDVAIALVEGLDPYLEACAIAIAEHQTRYSLNKRPPMTLEIVEELQDIVRRATR